MAGRKSAKNKIEKNQQNAVTHPLILQDQIKDKKGLTEIGVAK